LHPLAASPHLLPHLANTNIQLLQLRIQLVVHVELGRDLVVLRHVGGRLVTAAVVDDKAGGDEGGYGGAVAEKECCWDLLLGNEGWGSGVALYLLRTLEKMGNGNGQLEARER